MDGRDDGRGRPRTSAARATVLGLAVGLGTGLLGPRVHAGDTNLPRTPVIHRGVQCMTVVDRAIDPVLHLDYTIPFADTCRGSDEVDDSRSHQFFALCRAPSPDPRPPNWAHAADVDACVDAGVLGTAERPPASEVLDQSAAWQGCAFAITTADERRPIDCATASGGIDWDTRDVPSGAYLVYGYTYHPPFNTWVRRPGVVKVTEGEGDDPPAVALQPHETLAGRDRPLPLVACVDAPAGSTLRAGIRPEGSDEPWQVLAEQEVWADGEVSLSLELSPVVPAATDLVVMVEVQAPDGRAFRYESPTLVGFLDGPAPMVDPPPLEPGYDHCAQADDPDRPQDCGSNEDPDGDPPAGCGCRSSGSRPPGWLWLAWATVLATRRWRWG